MDRLFTDGILFTHRFSRFLVSGMDRCDLDRSLRVPDRPAHSFSKPGVSPMLLGSEMDQDSSSTMGMPVTRASRLDSSAPLGLNQIHSLKYPPRFRSGSKSSDEAQDASFQM